MSTLHNVSQWNDHHTPHKLQKKVVPCYREEDGEKRKMLIRLVEQRNDSESLLGIKFSNGMAHRRISVAQW